MAADSAASASGEVRRDGVTSSDAPFSRARRASFAPKEAASSGGKLKAWLSPPSSTVTCGWGTESTWTATPLAASARRGPVTLCTAPKVVITFRPSKLSCTGAATRPKSSGGTLGFWMWRPKAEAARLIASAMGTLRLPMEMTRRGQGGASGLLDSTERRRRSGGTWICSRAGRSRMAPLIRTRFRLKGRPTASATAMPCASVPTEPSVTIQVFWPLALRLAAIVASAPGRAGGAAGGSEGVAPAPPKLPERKTLNFFSILLAGGLKIARGAPESRCPRRLLARGPPVVQGAAIMRSARLDATDWRILRELQADGRITNVDLARKVGISAPPCLRRVRALEEAGIIKGFTAILNDKALGFDVTAVAMVGLHSQAAADLIAFEERARSSPIVRDCYMLSGEIDFLLKCVAPDLSAFQDFIIHELTAAPNVASVKTSLVIRASKRAAGVPMELAGEGSAAARPVERAPT